MNIRKLALKMLTEYEELGKYINLSLSSHSADSLTEEERALLTALLYSTVEHKLTYDYYICALSGRGMEQIDSYTKNILRLGICQILEMKKIPDFAAVNESARLARNPGERSFVNGILRAVVRKKDALPLPDKNKNYPRYLSVYHSVPLWIVKKLIADYGREEAEALLESMNRITPTDLTVNTLKTTREKLCKRLSGMGLSAEISDISPLSVRIAESVDPRRIEGFSDGEFTVQDAACSAAVSALGIQKGDFVIDVCACPGGKSFAAAIIMQDCGKINAYDIHESKLSLIEETAGRLGIVSVRASVRDATMPDESLFATADRVICDVPCSGIGVVAKKPDLRYKPEEGIGELPQLQYSILEASAKYLKPGGRMIYSTCTLIKEENEKVVELFLKNNKNYHTVDFSVGSFRSVGGMFTFLPHIHKTDGFFVSLIEKDKL
jgi:16S rRNA (cytosine967-C5)-methyltransferase